MKCLLNILVGIALFASLIFAPQTVLASNEGRNIDSLLEKIEVLRSLIAQRVAFAETGPVLKTNEDPEYFTLEALDIVPVFGPETELVEINTDGSVSQLLLTSTCNQFDGTLKIMTRDCQDKVWVSEFEEENGIRTFSVPVRFDTSEQTALFEIDVFACRYNGCQHEKTIELKYKNKVTFADQLRIYDRYEWEYEWNDNVYHVQEVLLNFPFENIRKVKLRVTCEGKGLYIRTDEEERATCYSRRDYSQVDFGEIQTDEQGNVYNLRVESVTDNITQEESGFVKMEFTFFNWQNRLVHTAYHTPVQKEEVGEESE